MTVQLLALESFNETRKVIGLVLQLLSPISKLPTNLIREEALYHLEQHLLVIQCLDNDKWDEKEGGTFKPL